MEPSSTQSSALLTAAGQGDLNAQERLTPTIYSELRRLASSYLSRERQGHTLQPTDLVHEAFLRLINSPSPSDRNHFVALSANSMRRVLVDHAREKQAVKRSGGRQVTLSTALFSSSEPTIEVLDLDRALDKLAQVNEPASKLVELRFFGGLTCEEAAEVLDVSLTTVERRWRAGKLWLRRELAIPSDSKP